MPTSARKINFMIRDEIARDLEELVPAGERSRTVNDALAKELLSIRRRKLTERLDTLRKKGPTIATEEIVAALQKERESH
jgi:hypothetical protein